MKNGVPQGSVLAPNLLNDQSSRPSTARFLNAEYLALLTQTTFEEATDNLTAALDELGTYYDANSLRSMKNLDIYFLSSIIKLSL